jgi:DNA-binding transcriptional LysR family regulator
MDIDLNLLRTFDALMEQRSVTRAASHLGVTQPAVSHALARLRKALNDPLFIRSPNGLQPTARAEEIAGGIRRGLHEFRDALAPTSFDPATAERHFTLATTSYFNALLIPALVERIRAEAPGIALRLVASNEMIVPQLDRGAIDLALGASIDVPARIVLEPLYREKMVWIAAPDNPVVRERLPLDRIGDEAQIVIIPGQPFGGASLAGDDVSTSDGHVIPEAANPHLNRVGVYDSQTAIALVARTDLVARVPEWMAELALAEGRITTLDWIPENASYQMTLIWHARRRTDQGLAWLRARITGVAQARARSLAPEADPEK